MTQNLFWKITSSYTIQFKDSCSRRRKKYHDPLLHVHCLYKLITGQSVCFLGHISELCSDNFDNWAAIWMYKWLYLVWKWKHSFVCSHQQNWHWYNHCRGLHLSVTVKLWCDHNKEHPCTGSLAGWPVVWKKRQVNMLRDRVNSCQLYMLCCWQTACLEKMWLSIITTWGKDKVQGPLKIIYHILL